MEKLGNGNVKKTKVLRIKSVNPIEFELDFDFAYEMYDSHGIPAEIVLEEVKKAIEKKKGKERALFIAKLLGW